MPLAEEGQGIRVLLADDDRTFLDALRELIDRQPISASSALPKTVSRRSSKRTTSIRTRS